MKIFVVEKYDGMVMAEVEGNILEIKEGEYKNTKFNMVEGAELATLKAVEWDNQEAEELTTYETEEEARKALKEMDVDSYYSANSESLGYTYYKLQEVEEDEEGEVVLFKELDTKVDNTELINDVREAIIDEEKAENEDYLTNLFGEERIASKKEIMERDNFSGMLWEEILEDVNEDELNYYIAEEDFNFDSYELETSYLKADVKGWVAGNFYNIVDWETGLKKGTETKKANIVFNTGGSGGVSNRVNLPSAWVNALGVTKEDKAVMLEFKNNKIIISKA